MEKLQVIIGLSKEATFGKRTYIENKKLHNDKRMLTNIKKILTGFRQENILIGKT